MAATIIVDPLAESIFLIHQQSTVADPGFPVGGHGPVRGHGPLTQALFGENVCENERIGSRRGWRAPDTPLPRSTNEVCARKEQ